MPHVQGTVIVNFKEVSQALHNFFSASFTKARNNTLVGLSPSFCWFAIDQVFTQTLRCRLRFKTFAWLALTPVCTTSNLFGALHRPEFM